jgi:hypothetical protein
LSGKPERRWWLVGNRVGAGDVSGSIFLERALWCAPTRSGDFGGGVARAAGGGGRNGLARISGSEDGSSGSATGGGPQTCRTGFGLHSAVRMDSPHCTGDGPPNGSRITRKPEGEIAWPSDSPDRHPSNVQGQVSAIRDYCIREREPKTKWQPFVFRFPWIDLTPNRRPFRQPNLPNAPIRQSRSVPDTRLQAAFT